MRGEQPARGSRVSFQACIRMDHSDPVRIQARAVAPKGLTVRVRRVGCVPVPHHNTLTPVDELDGRGMIPGFVPDPLFDEDTALAAPGETVAFWMTVTVGKAVSPGPRAVRVRLTADGKPIASMTATVNVSKVVLDRRRDFRVTHWFYADALCDRYGVAPFGRAFWPICRD